MFPGRLQNYVVLHSLIFVFTELNQYSLIIFHVPIKIFLKLMRDKSTKNVKSLFKSVYSHLARIGNINNGVFVIQF